MSTRRPGSPSSSGVKPGAGSGASPAGEDPSATTTPRSVYVRRRIIALLGLVAIVAAIALIIVRPGSTSGTSGDLKKVEVPSDLAAVPDTPSDDSEPETVACSSGQLEVQAATDQGSYGPGELPELSLSVTNTGKEDCIADLGTGGMTFAVSSGSDEVWRSIDCQASRDELPIVLNAGQTLESEAIPWDRTRSSTETCEIVRDPVVAGGASYHLSVSVGGVSSQQTAQFLLY